MPRNVYFVLIIKKKVIYFIKKKSSYSITNEKMFWRFSDMGSTELTENRTHERIYSRGVYPPCKIHKNLLCK